MALKSEIYYRWTENQCGRAVGATRVRSPQAVDGVFFLRDSTTAGGSDKMGSQGSRKPVTQVSSSDEISVQFECLHALFH